MNSIQYYVIKFVNDFRQVGRTTVSSTNKTDRQNITETLLRVAVNTINQAKTLLMGFSLFEFSKNHEN